MKIIHDSDCAVHNEPAYPNGPCDCGAEMVEVADRFAHRLAMHLELFLSDYGGKYYTDALNTLGEYRSAMNAIHEKHCPTFMGEPVIPKREHTTFTTHTNSRGNG